MGIQATQGKAFEYACLLVFYSALAEHQPVKILDTAPLQTAEKAYIALESDVQREMEEGAKAAVKMLFRLEPQLENPGRNVPLFLTIQKDSSGTAGDVRDILAIRQQNEWEIGVSVKHNHDAVKHSRLSQTIDFGESWFGTSCCSDYFAEIEPIFRELSELRERNTKWRQLQDKEERFYVPILIAFIKELKRLNEQYGERIPQELLKYLLGRHDFYKIIADTKRRITKLQAFSFYGTLNNPAGRIRPMYRIPQIRLPEVIHNIDFKPGSKTTLYIVCDQGWQLSARIHNASSRVEPSLKFDIKLIGLPPSVYSHDEPWGIYDLEQTELSVAETRKRKR